VHIHSPVQFSRHAVGGRGNEGGAGERERVGEGTGEGAWTGEMGAEDFKSQYVQHTPLIYNY